MKIPIAKTQFSDRVDAELVKVVRSGWVAQGPKVKELEEKLAGYTGARHAVAVSTGTAALHLAILAYGLTEGDEVIMPSFSFIATANAVVYAGLRPVFCDIDPVTYNIDPDVIETLITERTRAIMPVHQFGMPCDMTKIAQIAGRHDIKIIEDAACALGSLYNGVPIGKTTGIACFSFHPRKTITTAEGGMITTDDISVADRLFRLRNHGDNSSGLSTGKSPGFPDQYGILGFNYRMSDVHAVLGLDQIDRLEEFTVSRNNIAARYNERLRDMDCLQLPVIPEDNDRCNFQSYLLRLRSDAPLSRDELVSRLLVRGIGTKQGIPPIHLQSIYTEKVGRVRLPVTEEVAYDSFFLPIFPALTDREFDYIIGTLRKVLA